MVVMTELTGAVRNNVFVKETGLHVASLTGKDSGGRVRVFQGAGFDYGDAETRLESVLASARVRCVPAE